MTPKERFFEKRNLEERIEMKFHQYLNTPQGEDKISLGGDLRALAVKYHFLTGEYYKRDWNEDIK